MGSGSAQTLNRVPGAGCAAGRGLLVADERATAALQGAPLGPFLPVLGPVTLSCTVTVARPPYQPDPGLGGSATATRTRDGAERAARCWVRRRRVSGWQRCHLRAYLLRLGGRHRPPGAGGDLGVQAGCKQGTSVQTGELKSAKREQLSISRVRQPGNKDLGVHARISWCKRETVGCKQRSSECKRDCGA